MKQRIGPFWDAVAGRAPLPPAAATLGLEVLDVDPERGTIELAFAAPHAFTTPFGDVLGGFLAAMLYDTVGPALLATLEPEQFRRSSSRRASGARRRRAGWSVGDASCTATAIWSFSRRR